MDLETAFGLLSSKHVNLSQAEDEFATRLRKTGLAEDFAIYSQSLSNRAIVRRSGRPVAHMPGMIEKPSDWVYPDGWTPQQVDFSDMEVLRHYKPARLTLAIKAQSEALAPNELGLVFRRYYNELLAKQRTVLRNDVVRAYLRSRDINSFCHKVTDKILPQVFGSEAGSVFTGLAKNKNLHLASTTGLRSEVEKSNVYYEPTDKSWVVATYNERQARFEYRDGGGLVMGRFAERVKAGWSRAYVPLDLQAQNQTADRPWLGTGVLRILNVRRSASDPIQRTYRPFTWEDHYLLEFLAELMSVLNHGLVMNRLVQHSIEKIVHGYRSAIDGSLDAARTLRDWLFGNEEDDIRAQVRFADDVDPQRVQEVDRFLESIESFLEDVTFQIAKSSKDNIDKLTERQIITKLGADVLQKAVNLKHKVAHVHSRANPDISDLRKAGAFALPPVVGNEGGLLSVFRNLLENSIKYTPKGQKARIDISFAETKTHLEIVFRDFGIGIPKGEENLIFAEGYRGRKAREISLKGAGVGLAYCADILKGFDGYIKLRPGDVGTCFVIGLKLADYAGPLTGNWGNT